MDGATTSRLRLEPVPSSVAEARRLVRRALTEAGHDELVEAAELATSELVTNALVHAGTHIDLAVMVRAGGVRVEIVDGSAHLPTERAYGTAAGTGRGLIMVDQLVDDWGMTRRQVGLPGKVVWFEIGTEGPAEGEASDAARRAEPPGDVVEVRLIGVPLLLHSAWQQHIVALLREHLLSTLAHGTAEQAIQVHAQASDALSVISEHIPRHEFGAGPEQMMAASNDPATARADITVPVPHMSVPHFAALDVALERALKEGSKGAYLTPATQPELRELRRWICTEVARQSRGEAPRPWPGEEVVDGEPVVSPVSGARYLVQTDGAVVAADDTDTIVAVNEAAARLLGYAGPADLEGRRLVTLVPPRFRQAHLAGFALHLYSGRSLIVGESMRLPVLRRDGSEVRVELVVTRIACRRSGSCSPPRWSPKRTHSGLHQFNSCKVG